MATRSRRKGGTAPAATYPAVGKIFTLTLDGDAHPPLEMVRRDGYGPRGWRHTGPVVRGTQTRRFKLVKIGYCPNFGEVRRRLAAQGKIPEGQWREALKAAYAKDGQGPIGIADASWVSPFELANFPCVDSRGVSDFYWTVFDFYAFWRWPVEVGK